MKKKIRNRLLAFAGLAILFPHLVSFGAVGSVTSYEKATWGVSTGKYTVNGNYAFCCEYNKTYPLVGTPVEEIYLTTNDLLRKVLYYGCYGPQNTLGTDDRAHVLTAIAASDANIGEEATGAAAKYDVYYWELVNNPAKYPSPPSNFQVYIAVTSSASQQNLVFYQIQQNGYARLEKQSAKPEYTQNNSCYSLKGAVYGVYNHLSATESYRVGTLTTNENGTTNTLELEPGTYYSKELTPSPGYKLNEEIIKFTVSSEQTTVIHALEDPKTQDLDLLLQKVDAETGQSGSDGYATLKGAHFLVSHYGCDWQEGTTEKPLRSWVFQTDEKGQVKYQREYQVSGDELYEHLPLGSLLIQEIQAPPGYELNTNHIVLKAGETWEVPVIKEERITYKLKIKKSDNYDNLLSGAEFGLYKDEACAEPIMTGETDENGELVFEELKSGVKYYVKELKAPAGYKLSEEVYEVYSLEKPEGEIVELKAVNEVDKVFPKAGSALGALMGYSGILISLVSMYFMMNKKVTMNKKATMNKKTKMNKKR